MTSAEQAVPIHDLMFYRQKRFDGGVRTAIEVDGETLWQHFEAGQDEEEPALLWYIDIRCTGAALPQSPEEAKAWLENLTPVLKEAFTGMAERLQVGFDDEFRPYSYVLPIKPDGVTVTLVFCVTRRLDALSARTILLDFIAHWQDYLAMLEQAVPVGG